MTNTEEIELRLLLDAIFERYQYDFRGYSMRSIGRRLRQAQQYFQCESLSMLQHRVLHDPAVLPRLLNYLTIQVLFPCAARAGHSAPEDLSLPEGVGRRLCRRGGTLFAGHPVS
jgi:hypothetical protein